MKILYLCTYYHRAMIFRDSLDSLEKRGDVVRVFNAVEYGASIDEKYKSIMDEKVYHRECFSKYDRFNYFKKQRKIYDELIRTVDVSQFDLIHSHTMMNGGWVAKKIKKNFGIPYIITARNTDLNDYLKIPFFIPIARSIIKEAECVMFLSDTYKNAIINRCFFRKSGKRNLVSNKSRVIPNGLEKFWLENKGEVKTKCHDKLRLLCVGKIDHNKNMKTILLAMEELRRKGYFSHLTIIGQIVDNDIFYELKNSKDVSVVDYLKKEELIFYYRNCDIYVMPSFTESFGRVYAEAMTQGVPVIYTKEQGFDGIFEEGKVGFSVNPHDPSDIANAIIKIINKYSNISRMCIDKCEIFNWDKITDSLQKMYYETIGEKI